MSEIKVGDTVKVIKKGSSDTFNILGKSGHVTSIQLHIFFNIYYIGIIVNGHLYHIWLNEVELVSPGMSESDYEYI